MKAEASNTSASASAAAAGGAKRQGECAEGDAPNGAAAGELAKCEQCRLPCASMSLICTACHEERVDKAIAAARGQIARVVRREIDKAVKVRIMRVETMDDIMGAVERAVKGGGPE